MHSFLFSLLFIAFRSRRAIFYPQIFLKSQKKRPPKWPLLNRRSSQALADVSSFAAYQINKPNAILLSTSARL